MSDEYLIVTEDIPANQGTVYAYRAGDRITRDAVEANGWHDYVATPSSKAAKTAVAEATATTKEK
jgi:hypothetical protein